jgi:hypothetical protein
LSPPPAITASTPPCARAKGEQAQPQARARSAVGTDAVVRDLELEGVRGGGDANVDPAGLRVFLAVPHRLDEDRLRQAFQMRRDVNRLRPAHHHLGGALRAAAHQLGELHPRRPSVSQRAPERGAQLANHGLQLVVARLTLGRGKGLARAQREHQPEQPLHHTLVDFAGELDSLAEASRALVLPGGALDARGERREPAEREDRLPLLRRELEAAATLVGEDHAQPAAACGHGAAHDRRDARESRIPGRQLALEVLRGVDDPVLRQRPLCDRSLIESPLDLPDQGLVHPMRADRVDCVAGRVVQKQARALHRGQPAHRLAHVVVEEA